ncbi:ribosomal protein S21 family protein [Actinidia rufa]|uniref:Ribosomal protein S21 family protein n=1 Tax=Actinidia rufa TaxID=165716 RepID=A0A7J0FN76_9ERIC|nr:ribosomal protein S21 family protein [Actinidia rufa]
MAGDQSEGALREPGAGAGGHAAEDAVQRHRAADQAGAAAPHQELREARARSQRISSASSGPRTLLASSSPSSSRKSGNRRRASNSQLARSCSMVRVILPMPRLKRLHGVKEQIFWPTGLD